jgi:hypothetical protein
LDCPCSDESGGVLRIPRGNVDEEPYGVELNLQVVFAFVQKSDELRNDGPNPHQGRDGVGDGGGSMRIRRGGRVSGGESSAKLFQHTKGEELGILGQLLLQAVQSFGPRLFFLFLFCSIGKLPLGVCWANLLCRGGRGGGTKLKQSREQRRR